MKLFRLVLALIVLAFATPAMAAATTLNPAYVTWGANPNLNPGPVQQVGYDSITGLPCIVGATTTCALDRVPFVSDYEVSAANTAQTFTYSLRNLNASLSISAVCSAGTATVTVSASPDNTHFVTIDSIAAAASTVKFYGPTTVGASTALSPLSFPYVTIAVGACGSGNTSTLIVGAK